MFNKQVIKLQAMLYIIIIYKNLFLYIIIIYSMQILPLELKLRIRSFILEHKTAQIMKRYFKDKIVLADRQEMINMVYDNNLHLVHMRLMSRQVLIDEINHIIKITPLEEIRFLNSWDVFIPRLYV